MVATYLNAFRLFSRDARLFLVTSFLIGFTVFGGIYTFLLNLYLLRLGFGPEFVGLVNAVGSLGLALFALPAGAVGTRWGSRRTMIAGLALVALGNTFLPLAEFVPVLVRPGWLIATNLLGSLGMTFYIVNITPFLMGVTGSTERNHVFSVQAALWPLAGFAGSLVAGMLPRLVGTALKVSLDHPLPYRYPLLMAGLLLSLGVVAMLKTDAPAAVDRQAQTAERGPMPVGIIALFGTIVFLAVAGEGLTRTFFNVYLDDGLHASTSRIGALAALGQLVAVPAALAMPMLAARWGHAQTYLLASLGLALSLLPLALAPHWGAAGLGFMGVIALASISRPASMVYQMELVTQGWRVAIASAGTTAVGLSWAIMAVGGGSLIPLLGYRVVFALGALISGAGACLFWAGILRPRRRLTQPPALQVADEPTHGA